MEVFAISGIASRRDVRAEKHGTRRGERGRLVGRRNKEMADSGNFQEERCPYNARPMNRIKHDGGQLKKSSRERRPAFFMKLRR